MKPYPRALTHEAFAERHQVLPLGIGLGNDAESLAAFRIGMPEQTRARVAPAVFDVWAFGHLQPSLWDACQSTAQADDELTPTAVLRAVMQALPVLLAVTPPTSTWRECNRPIEAIGLSELTSKPVCLVEGSLTATQAGWQSNDTCGIFLPTMLAPLLKIKFIDSLLTWRVNET